jgi:hypothetical protein
MQRMLLYWFASSEAQVQLYQSHLEAAWEMFINYMYKKYIVRGTETEVGKLQLKRGQAQQHSPDTVANEAQTPQGR